MRKSPSNAVAGAATARAYTSPTLVLLAMDWAEGADRKDFLGFAIMRSPGFAKGEQDGYLLNKIGFQPLQPDSQPLPSNLAPIQKFLWWDPAVTDKRGSTFTYTITPVCGTGPNDLQLIHDSEAKFKVTLPQVERDNISTWFNRAVVSSQAFAREFPDPQKDLDKAMDWLANGIEDAFTQILSGSRDIDGAVYHLTDNMWVLPALKKIPGKLSLVYEGRPNDPADDPAIAYLNEILGEEKFEGFARKATNIMHDKFLVDVKNGRVLMGSANFTPEALTCQANLLHIFDSKQLADLFDARQKLIQPDPSKGETATKGAWSDPVSVGSASVRVFFSPEPGKQRDSINAVLAAINAAKKSVAFCMFDPTDPDLLKALLAVGDQGKLLYGMLNSISDPSKPTKKKSADKDLADSGEPPKKPTATTQIKVILYNRSQKDRKVLAYAYFQKGRTPEGFLPEFNTLDTSSKKIAGSVKPAKSGTKKGTPPAVHIHHKFIIIDAETDHPIIYTGSNNLSNNSTHNNDENLLEIKGTPELAQTYFAEFMRLYEHYRARAIWNMEHPARGSGMKKPTGKQQAFVLAKTRDGWVRKAYQEGTPDFMARSTLAAEPAQAPPVQSRAKAVRRKK